MEEEIIKKRLLGEINDLKSPDGYIYAGLPRFKGLFGRDSLITSWQLLNYDSGIARTVLETLAKFQGKKVDPETGEEPGKILHELYPENTPDEWWNEYKASVSWLKRGRPVYRSVDSTPLFIIVAAKYFEKTGDKEFISKIFPNIKRVIDWIDAYGDKDKDGFVEYERDYPAGLFHQGWKDSERDHLKIDPPVAIVEMQGYAYAAFLAMAKMANALSERALDRELTKKAKKLKSKFNEKFWMEKEKYFCLGLDGKKNQRKAVTSNPGHLLFTGIAEEDKINLIVKRLSEPDMRTSYGIRTHSEKEPDFDPRSYHLGSVWPHDNWIIAQGLKTSGYEDEYRKIKNALLAAYREIGFIPEFYGVIDGKITLEMKDKPCHPQAWAACAIFNFLEEE